VSGTNLPIRHDYYSSSPGALREYNVHFCRSAIRVTKAELVRRDPLRNNVRPAHIYSGASPVSRSRRFRSFGFRPGFYSVTPMNHPHCSPLWPFASDPRALSPQLRPPAILARPCQHNTQTGAVAATSCIKRDKSPNVSGKRAFDRFGVESARRGSIARSLNGAAVGMLRREGFAVESR
jgi:hypothetical protein